MRRTLACAAVALAALAAPASAAQQGPPKPLDGCDIAQNCLCLLVAGPVKATTGYQLHCI